MQLLATIPNYNPDEDELKLTNLNTYKDSLINATQFVDQTEAELNIKLIERDQILYAEETGLYSIAQNVKNTSKAFTEPLHPNMQRFPPLHLRSKNNIYFF